MNKNKANLLTSGATPLATNTIGNPIMPQLVRRVLQNFLLIWLDANFDETNEDFKKSLQRLRSVVACIQTYKDAKQCINFLSEVKIEKILMIVSGSLGQQVLPEIEQMPQLESVYIFCGNKSYHEKWTKKILKIKGVYTNIESICDDMKIAREKCDRQMVAISFNRIDPLFMYTQLLKEAFLEIQDDDTQSIQGLIEYCRLQEDIPENEIIKIERDYHDHTPIWWYTAPYFIYSMLNRGLRVMDTDIILKMGFFIRHLHNDIDMIYRGQQQSSKNSTNENSTFCVYRGQGLSFEDFEKMKLNNKGGLMSFNNFLSTSRNREISLNRFSRPPALQKYTNTVGILFVIIIKPTLCQKSSIPYADVKDVGYFKDDEEEILFTTHTIFRIDHIKKIPDHETDRLWEVQLTLVDNNDKELNELTLHLSKELAAFTGWSRLGEIFIRLGEHAKAENLYKVLLEKSTKEIERGAYYNQLGSIYVAVAEYPRAVSCYEQSIEIMRKTFPPNFNNLASGYNNMAALYCKMGEHTRALSYYETSTKIMSKTIPPNLPNLASNYNNMAAVYCKMDEHSKALSYYEQAIEIMRKTLPLNHPNWASSYNNMAAVYCKMDEHSKAVTYYEQAIKIMKIALPPNHPDLAATYNNIGSVCESMDEYSKAITYYEQSLEIKKIALPPNHPDLAATYNNIGSTYDSMGEYSKALLYYEKSLEIKKVSLAPNHLSLASSYNNIGSVYYNTGEYSKALSFFEQSVKIKELAHSANHPLLATSYNNIASVYHRTGEYSKALAYYEKAQSIWTKSLPSNHPNISIVKNNIEILKKNM